MAGKKKKIVKKVSKKKGMDWDNLPKEFKDKLSKQVKVRKMIVISPKNVMRWVLYLLIGFYFLGMVLTVMGPEVSKISLSEAIRDIKEGRVESVKVTGDKISLKLVDEAGVLGAIRKVQMLKSKSDN